MSLLDWTESETISPPDKITIQWVTDPAGTAQPETRKQVLTSTTVSRSKSTYETISYQTVDGKVSSQDVQVSKEDTKIATIASVNQEYVTARLKYNRSLPAGNDQERSVTTYEHSISSDGPILSKETTEVHISFVSLAGQLQGIPYRWSASGGNYDYYDPPGGEIVSQKTIVQYEQVKTVDGRTVAITKTSRWIALGLTSEGKGSFERWMKAIKDVGSQSSEVIDEALRDWSELVFQGTEVSTSTGRIPAPSKPSDTDVAYSEVENGSAPTSTASPETVYGNNAGWTQYTPPELSLSYLRSDSNGDGVPNWADYIPPGIPWQSLSTEDSDYRNPVRVTSNEKSIKGRVIFDGQDFSGENPTVTTTYEMPYAPDDYFYFDSSHVRKLHKSNSRQAAEQFGRVEAYLDVAHAFGYNIVTSFDRLPTLEMSTVYVRLAGIEVAFLTDSLSYAFDASGVVISSDLMLMGVTGYYGATAPATSWIRLASSPSALPQAPTPSTSVALKANTISYPTGGIDPRNPAPVFALLGNTGVDAFGTYQGTPQLVGPTLELDTAALAAGPTVDAVDFNYALDTGTDVVALATGPAVDFAWVTTVASPAATIALAPLAPAISTGARVVVPAAAVQLAAADPIVASGAAVAVPAGAVVVVGVAPDLVGRQKTIINVPTADMQLLAAAPAIRRGAGVFVPSANIALAASLPVIQTGAVDPNYANVSLLLHMDGSADSTTFTNSGPSALTVEVVGGAKVTTANKKYGTGALTTAVSGGYLRIASNSVFNMGTSPFTIEFFAYCSDQTNTYAALIGNASPWGTNACSIRFDDTNGPQRFLVACNTSTGGTTLFSTSSTYTFNQWRHVAVVRNGTSMQIYVDGQLAGSATISAAAQFDWSAGGYFYVCYSFDGPSSNSRELIDELRVTKGIARYTSAFTPPAAAFPDR